jgi:LysM repeat protein
MIDAPMSWRVLFGYAAFTLVGMVVAAILFVAIRLMTQDTPSPRQTRTREASYVVRRGDVLSRIAVRTGVPVRRMLALNPSLDPLELTPGQRIRLRPSRVSAAERARRRRRERTRPRSYVVRPGDSLSAVSAKTGVPLYRLLELNRGAARRPIVPGQRIRLRR